METEKLTLTLKMGWAPIALSEALECRSSYQATVTAVILASSKLPVTTVVSANIGIGIPDRKRENA
jgi:hypothetical protein